MTDISPKELPPLRERFEFSYTLLDDPLHDVPLVGPFHWTLAGVVIIVGLIVGMFFL